MNNNQPYEIWIKDTKRGARYYMFSHRQFRSFPVNKAKAVEDILSGAARLVEYKDSVAAVVAGDVDW